MNAPNYSVNNWPAQKITAGEETLRNGLWMNDINVLFPTAFSWSTNRVWSDRTNFPVPLVFALQSIPNVAKYSIAYETSGTI